MEFEIDLKDPIKGMKDLFTCSFIANCTLDDESMTIEESKTLEELNPAEILENFKDLVLNLLRFKKEYKSSDKAELAQRNEQFESLLQKLEAEVRNHIRVEHQLKLHIENHQQRIDELEKTGTNDKTLIKELEEKCGGKKVKNNEVDKIKRELEDKIKGLTETIEKKDKSLHKAEFEVVKLRNLLEEKVRECESVKKELARLKVTPKGKEVARSIEKLPKRTELKKMSSLKGDILGTSARCKKDRKSLCESELVKFNMSPYTKKDSKKEESKTGNQPARGHFRSNSEQKLLNSKRTTSR